MHRNTFLLVLFLAIFASLVVGVNLGRRFPTPQPQTTKTAVSPTSTPVVSEGQALSLLEYRNTYCGIAFRYPGTLQQIEGATGSAVLVNQEKPEESVVVTCQKDIPRPALAPERIEVATVSGVTARLYHDTSAKDGTPIDTLILRHPKTGLDVFLAGSGPTFQGILSTLKILQ